MNNTDVSVRQIGNANLLSTADENNFGIVGIERLPASLADPAVDGLHELAVDDLVQVSLPVVSDRLSRSSKIGRIGADTIAPLILQIPI